MANLNVRIYNKFDTYENWMKSTLVLGAGEIAIASIPSGDNTGLTPPAIGVKVGDGSKTFSQLSWIQATAGDVYSWAKAATKPEYAASEITGLADFISGEIQDSNTEYSFSLAENYKLKIQKKDIGGEYADYQTIDLTSAFAAKADKVTGATAGNFAGLDSNGNLTDSGKKAADFATAAQGALADSALQKADITTGSANGTIAVEGADVAVKGLGSAAFTESSAYATAGHNHDSAYAAKAATEAHISNADIHVTTNDKSKWNTASTKAAANESAISAIKDGTTIDSFADVETALAGKQAAGDYATKTEAQGYADAKDSAIAAAKKAGDDAQADVNALEQYVGTFTAVDDETTVVGYVDAKIAAIPAQINYSVTVTESTPEGYAKSYAFTQCGKSIATINIPKDMVVSSGSVVTNPKGQPAGTYIKLVLANSDNSELFINVGDLIEYVTGDTAADGMITVSVDANHVATATINNGTVTLAKLESSVQTAIGKAHTHENKALLDTYTQTEANLADAVAKKHSHANATVLDGISSKKVTAWDDAAAKAHTHGNKTVLDGITAEKIAAWDAAQANVLEGIAGVEGSIANKTFTVSGVSTDLLKQGSETLIFNCGNSVV